MSEKIEITEEMIEAGINKLMDFHDEYYSSQTNQTLSELVIEVFEAMQAKLHENFQN